MLVFEVQNCSKCPFHETHQIITPDSFEHEIGIYCSEVEDTTEDFARHTYDGTVNKKLVVADDWNVEEYARVPGWCPHRQN
jgi:hypothetical protein